MKIVMLTARSLPGSEKYERQGRIWGDTSPPKWLPRISHNQFYEEKRSSSLEERRNFYAKARIHDQKRGMPSRQSQTLMLVPSAFG